MRGSKSTTTHTYNSRCPLSNRRPDESSSQKITGKPNRQNRYHTYHHIDSTAPPPSCAPAQTFTFRSNSKGKRQEEKAARSGRGGGEIDEENDKKKRTSSMVSRSSVMSASLKNSALSDSRKLSTAIVRSRFTWCGQKQDKRH